MAYENILQCRFKNCLTTIFEVESLLENSALMASMQKDFLVLKQAANSLQGILLVESDVLRVEQATEKFLREISKVFSGKSSPEVNPCKVIQ